MSRIHGTRRIHEVTGGHEEDPIRVQEEPRGHHRTREDTPLRRFGTVRPRVQIPRPRPVSVFGFEFACLNLAPIRGPHGFQQCAIDLARLSKRLCM